MDQGFRKLEGRDVYEEGEGVSLGELRVCQLNRFRVRTGKNLDGQASDSTELAEVSSPHDAKRSLPPFRAGRGFGRPRIFGPRMLGVAGAKILTNLQVPVGPEAFQVVGDLLRAHVGSQKVQHDAHATASDPRCLPQSENLLNPH